MTPCADCDRRVTAIQVDLENAEADLRVERRTVKRLQAEIKTQREGAPEREDVLEIFNHWLRLSGKNPKTTKLTEDRDKKVLARLREGQTKERMCLAIDFVTSHPWSLYGEHYAEQQSGAVRRDDLSYIADKGSRLEKWADRQAARVGGGA